MNLSALSFPRPRRLRAFASLLGVALLALSCSPAPAGGPASSSNTAPASTGPKTLRMAMQTANEPASPALYGGVGSGSQALDHYFIFHTNMTVFDSQKNIVPRLATKVPTIDDGDWKILPSGGMEVTWKLKPNLVWQDGVPLTSDDFVYGFSLLKDPALAIETRGETPNITEVVAVDPQTLLIKWKSQSVNGNWNGHDGVPAVPRHIFKDIYVNGDVTAMESSPFWKDKFVGLGPFKLTSWSLGSQIEATAFDQYVGGRPKIDRLIIRYIGDVNALVANVLSGDIDVIPAGAQLDIGQMVTLRQAWGPTGGITLLNTKSVRTLYLQMRDTTLPWQDLRVRQALLYGLNRDELVDTLLSGLVPKADFYVTLEDPVYNLAKQRNLPLYPFDPAKSEKLMNDAGWTRGADKIYHNAAGQPFKIDVTGSGQGDNVTEATTIAGGWNNSGFQSVPTPYPPTADNAAEIRHRTPGALIWPWNFSTSDPQTLTAAQIGTDANKWRGGNYGGYTNKAYDGLWSDLSNELNATKRQETLFSMVKILSEDLPVLPVFYRATGFASRNGLTGPTATPPVQAGSNWNISDWDLK